jgi:hypothetical protein
MGQLYVKILNDVRGAFDSVGKGIADNIIDGKKWGDVFIGIGKNIAKTILEDVVGTAFKALANAILTNTSLIQSFSKAVSSMISGITGGVGSAVGGAASAAGGAAGAVESTTSAATSAAAGVTGVLGIAGAVGSIVSGITGIIGVFQSADLYGAMKAVALNTLGTANEVINLRADSWAREDHLMAKLDDIWNEIRNVVSAIKDLGISGVPTAPAYVNSSVSGSSASSGIGPFGTVHVHVNGVRTPTETARAVADMLRSLSPKFSPSTS